MDEQTGGSETRAVSDDGMTSWLRAQVEADKADVIADCDAKLAILGRYEKAAADAGEDPAAGEDAWLLSSVTRMLASGYRHREGWQEGWGA